MEDAIGFGGGGGFAIWIDANFNFGHSSKCETFGNTEPLVEGTINAN